MTVESILKREEWDKILHQGFQERDESGKCHVRNLGTRHLVYSKSTHNDSTNSSCEPWRVTKRLSLRWDLILPV
jgi:hypothetical protein